jgi:hypothetical protein
MDRNPEETTVDLIPGIGIIRARALKKAGWPTVAALRSASVDDLMAVPGITEIKAAQILEYVHSLSVETVSGNGTAATHPETADSPLSEVSGFEIPPSEAIAITFTGPAAGEEILHVYAVQSPRDLMQDVALSAQLLLTSEFSGKWERPFAAQLGKLISLHEKWDRFEPLGKKQSKQVMELLQKIYRLLTETPIAEITKKKSQEHLAEIIRDRRRRIRDIVDS